MASNGVSIDAKLNEQGVVTGAKKIKTSLEEIKQADGNLKWDGVKQGEQAAKTSGDGFTVLKGIFANLATQGIMVATSAIKEFASEVVTTGMGFESSMSKVSALSGATGDDFDALEAKAREMGASTTFSASEAADALGYMALAGWDTTDMLDGIGGVLTLAQAGEMDLAAASDLVTDYLSAFNMTAADTGRMVDVLAYAQANANTNTEQLGMSFKNCAANCNAAGMDVETTTAAISMMANQGLKGSEAGTALNAVMRDMTAKMEDGAIKIGETSIAVMDAQGNYRDFADILADVQDATNGMGDAEKASALQTTFTADSIKGLNLLLNAGSDELVGFRDELYNCNGAAQETADTMTDNLGGDVAAMGSAFEELQLKIYEGLQEPLRAATQFVTNSAIPAITWMMNNLPIVGTVIAGVAASILAFKTQATAAKVATSAWGVVTKAQTVLQGALNAIMNANPIGIIILAITALVAAFVYLWNNCEEFRNFWIGLWDAIMQKVQPIADWVFQNVITPISEKFAEFQSAFGELWNAIVAKVQEAWEFIAPIVQLGFQNLQTIFNAVLPVLQTIWDAAWGVISTVLGNAWNIMSGIVSTIMGVIQGIIQTVTALIQGDWDGVWNGIKSIFEAIVNGILQTAANIFNALSTTIGSILTGISSVWSSIWNAVYSVASGIWNNISSTIGGIINGISSTISSVINGIQSTVSSVFNAIQTAMTNPIETAKNTISGIVNTIKGFFSNFHIELPHIKLPHFSINPPGWQIGDLLKGSIPSLGIEWYAKGGVFNGASIIGVGEAGPEAVVPLQGKYMQPFAEAVGENMAMPSAQEIGQAVAAALLSAGIGQATINLDGRTVGQLLAPHLDTINGARYSNAVRGLAQ